MIDLLNRDYELYISQFTQAIYPDKAKKVFTYIGPISFLFSSVMFILFLPFLFLFRRLQYGQFIVYIPVLHPWNLWLAICSRIFFCPLVLTVHEFQMHTGERNRLLEFIQKVSIKLATKVVFLTQHEAKIAESPLDKKYLIDHPITDLPEVKNINKRDSSFKVLFLGRVNAYKGLDLLQKSATDLMSNDEISISIAGKWSIEKIPFPKNTTVLDSYLKEEEMSRLLSEHDVLVLPYTEASQSGIIALGIQSNTPMIVTKVGGLQEQLNSKEGLFIQPNSKELTDAILALSSDQQLYKEYQFALKAKKKNHNKYVGEQLNSLFDTLASS